MTQAKLHKLQNEKEAAEKAREAPKPSKEESSSKAAEVSAGGMSTEVPADLGTSKGCASCVSEKTIFHI